MRKFNNLYGKLCRQSSLILISGLVKKNTLGKLFGAKIKMKKNTDRILRREGVAVSVCAPGDAEPKTGILENHYFQLFVYQRLVMVIGGKVS